jgi:hypothetical protein
MTDPTNEKAPAPTEALSKGINQATPSVAQAADGEPIVATLPLLPLPPGSLRTREIAFGMTVIELPSYFDNDGSNRHLILWDEASRDRRVFATLRLLWQMRQLSPNIFVTAQLDGKLLLSLDDSPDVVEELDAELQRLSWALPLPVSVHRATSMDLQFAEKLHLGACDDEDDDAGGGL